MTGTVRVAAGRPAMLSGMKMQMDSQGRLTLTQAAGAVGVSPKTIIRWEKAGRIACPKRDWRGWRVFTREQVDEMIRLRERLY